MAKIRDERTGTDELLRDGRFHYAALLADPEAAHLAAAVKKKLDALGQAQAATQAAELQRLEKQALAVRAEYLHDRKHSSVELLVLGAVARNRRAPAYQDVYPHGLSMLIALSGEDQERAVTGMLDKLATHHPELHRKYGKELQKLAADATAAEKGLKDAQVQEDRAFLAEQSARSELSQQLRRNSGALISLFPEDPSLIRLYFRKLSKKRPTPPTPVAPSPSTPPAQP